MSVWDTYEQDVDDLERQGEEQNQLLEDAGLANASDTEQTAWLEDYYATQRQNDDLAHDREQWERYNLSLEEWEAKHGN